MAVIFSRSSLKNLIQTSQAVAKLGAKEKELLLTLVSRVNDKQLMKLFHLLEQEQAFMLELEKKVQKQLVKALEVYEMDLKTAVQASRRNHVKKAEKQSEKKEKKVAQNLLDQLNNL